MSYQAHRTPEIPSDAEVIWKHTWATNEEWIFQHTFLVNISDEYLLMFAGVERDEERAVYTCEGRLQKRNYPTQGHAIRCAIGFWGLQG